MKVAALPLPLPFANFTNRRSILALDNLIEAVLFAIATPSTIGETFVVADPDPLSLAEMIGALREAENRKPGLLKIPPRWIEGLLVAFRRPLIWERIGGSLVVSPKKLIDAGWRPIVESRAGLIASASLRAKRLNKPVPGVRVLANLKQSDE